MTVYGYRLNEVQFKESDKLPNAEVYLKDIVDSSVSESMSAGYGRYAKGISNDWTVDYDEVIVVISGVFTIHSEGKSTMSVVATTSTNPYSDLISEIACCMV